MKGSPPDREKAERWKRRRRRREVEVEEEEGGGREGSGAHEALLDDVGGVLRDHGEDGETRSCHHVVEARLRVHVLSGDEVGRCEGANGCGSSRRGPGTSETDAGENEEGGGGGGMIEVETDVEEEETGQEAGRG